MDKIRRYVAARVRMRVGGQSLPIIALMIVTLFGMVGMAVDVGNTYAEQRKVVSGANAAAIAGMDTYIQGGSGVKDQDVHNAIIASLQTNDIPIGNRSGELTLKATYLGADGKPVTTGCSQVGCGGTAPTNVGYIQVEVNGLVDTFFARVVGRPTLPIDATSYAGLCPAADSVYPIAVDSTVIDGDNFKNPGTPGEYGKLTSGTFRNYTWRRIYVHDNNVPGSFSWLRWNEDKDPSGLSSKSENALQASLTGPGNLSQGFDEAPWPSTNMAKPSVYPEKPGQLNVGDWVHGTTGAKRSNDIRNLLTGYVTKGTVMILPIYDVAVGNGVNGAFRVSRLGAFVMLGYNEQNGKQPYFDFVFLGDATNSVACTTTAVEPQTMGVAGKVEIWPEYKTIPQSQKPVQYVVVLDVSGSMNFNFDGKGKNNKQCTNSPDPTAKRDDCSSPTYASWAWPKESERRIYVAKKAITRLVELMNIQGNTSYKTNRPPDQMLIIAYSDGVKTTSAWSSKSTELKQWVLDAGKYDGSAYLTNGGTASASGLHRASQQLQSADVYKTHTDGKKYTYKKVVVFVTDGVANYFLNPSKSDLSGGFSDNSTYPKGHWCRSVSSVGEEPQCMLNDIGGKYGSFDRPITAMVNTSSSLLKPIADVYVVAMSAIPNTGLRDGVASFPSTYAEAKTLTYDANGKTNVDKIFENINTQIEYGQCIPQSDNQWLKQILSQNASSDLSYPTVGMVYLSDSSTGTNYSAPITASTDGYLSYTFTNVPQGTYKMTAYTLYRHPLDMVGSDGKLQVRQYDQIFMQEENFPDGIAVTLKPSANFANVVEQNLQLKLSGSVCVAQ